MAGFQSQILLLGLVILVAFASPTFAFGAGNIASISKIEGQNWRHGDIEDALLTLTMAQAMKGRKFNKINVSRVYFGNWLRDYSQAIDVGTVKSVSAEAIRLLLCVLGFMTFGYGSGEFEVTADRLGCYRPEEHIDNPKNYADNIDARQYDRRLRGPIDEDRELSIDPETGMKNYIANERAGIMTSKKLVKKLLGGCIELGRRYRENERKVDKYESLRLMGTGLHCLEDFFAHSNYCELALIEMGERDIFPHVGSDTEIDLEGANGRVYPIVTGTFGGVDFLHSVTGEVSDKLTQNEIEELEGTLEAGANSDTSLLRDLLDKIPDGIFGDKNQSQKVDELQSNAQAAQMENLEVSPRDPEEFTLYVQRAFQQVMPAIEFHDNIMKSISNATEKIPVLPKIIEQLEEQLSVFIFSIIAPFIVPLIKQIRNELKTGSEEIISSSENEQHIVFNDDRSTDPTHSMLSKDHFSNVLNEIAGRNAASMVHWVVPQLMDAIDDDSVDIDELLHNITEGVLHHPAQREMGNRKIRECRQRCFDSVREWWGEMGQDQQEDYRRKLSRDGVQNGENHKEGVYDTGHGHGCAGKLKMRKLYGGGPETLEDKIAGAAADAIFKGATGAISGIVEQNTGYKMPSSGGGGHEEEKKEGGLSGFLNVAGNILGGFGKNDTERETSSHHNDDGSYTRTQTEYGHDGNRYGQAEYSQTQYQDGSRRDEYRRYEQQDSDGGHRTQGYGYEERTETRPSYGGGYEQRTERHEYEGSSDNYGGGHSGRRHDDDERRHDGGYGGGHGGYGGGHGGGYGREERREESSYGGGYGGGHAAEYERRDEGGYGGGHGGGYERREEGGYGDGGGEYGRQGGGYGGGHAAEYERRDEGDYGRRDDEYEGRHERREGHARDYERGGDYDNGHGGDRRW